MSDLIYKKLDDVDVVPNGYSNDCAFSPDGNYLALAHRDFNYCKLYKKVGDMFINDTVSNISVTSHSTSCAFSPDGAYLAFVGSWTNGPAVFKFANGKYSKISDALFNEKITETQSRYCTFSPDGKYLVVLTGYTPFIHIYKIEDNTFNKLPNPSVLPSGASNYCAFSLDGNHLAVTHEEGNFITVYKIEDDTFVKLPDINTTGAKYNVYGCAFSNDGMYFAAVSFANPFLIFYERTGDNFVRVEQPNIVINSSLNNCSFLPDGKHFITFGPNFSSINPSIKMYSITEGLLTLLETPVDILIDSSVQRGTVSTDGKYLAVALRDTPYIAIYKQNESGGFNKIFIITDEGLKQVQEMKLISGTNELKTLSNIQELKVITNAGLK